MSNEMMNLELARAEEALNKALRQMAYFASMNMNEASNEMGEEVRRWNERVSFYKQQLNLS